MGVELLPEHETTQNENQQQGSRTEEEHNVANEMQLVPKDHQAQKHIVNKEPGRPKRAMKPPQRYMDFVKT